ncbi:MAG: DUF2345 domain-containing protein [Pseudomonas indica]|nr:DUF2345 domain-containing protein [Pseudomonas indica]
MEANAYSEFKAEEHRITHLDRKTELKANDHLTVGQNQHIKIGTGQFLKAGQEIHLSSGVKVVLEAGSELTLKGGGSWLKLDGSGVTLTGPTIKMNSGGSPGKGSGASPALPGQSKAADNDKAGYVLTLPQIQTLKRNAPFCEECVKCKDGACVYTF